MYPVCSQLLWPSPCCSKAFDARTCAYSTLLLFSLLIIAQQVYGCKVIRWLTLTTSIMINLLRLLYFNMLMSVLRAADRLHRFVVTQGILWSLSMHRLSYSLCLSCLCHSKPCTTLASCLVQSFMYRRSHMYFATDNVFMAFHQCASSRIAFFMFRTSFSGMYGFLLPF